MHMNPYLTFNGQCKEAFTFYERCLGGKIDMLLTHGESPMAEHGKPELRDLVMHARLSVGDNLLMGSDAPPGNYEAPQGFSVALGVDTPAEAQRIFHALGDRGTIRMPLQQTFWSVSFGMVVDRFGIPWMINCEQEAA